MTTEKMKRAVAFCEDYCDEKFNGDINDFNTVSNYLSRNLEVAKDRAFDLYLFDQDNRWK